MKKSSNPSFFKNHPILSTLLLTILPVIVGFFGMIYSVIFHWLSRLGFIGLILAIVVLVAASFMVFAYTYGMFNDLLVVHADDYVGEFAERHEALCNKITWPIACVMGILTAAFPFTADPLNNIAFKLCSGRVPGFLHTLISLWFLCLPMTIAVVIEVKIFYGKLEALHNESVAMIAKINAAEQQRIAAEQKRIAAEQQRIAAEREVERQRIAAEQEAKRKAEEAKKAAAEEAERQRVKEERKRAISNQKAVKDFRDRLAKDYDVDFTFLKNLPTASASSFQEELSEDEAVWARNDERFEAIEKLIRSTGFSPEELQPPRFPYESAFLEYVFSLDSPIAQCADKYNRFEGIRIKNKVLPAAYLIDTMMAIDRAIAGLGEYYKRGIDIYREDYNIMKAGLRGEWAVQDILDMHAGAFLVIHDLRMEFPGRGDRVDSVEIDTLVLAPNGIFAVEVKNYGASGRYKIIVTGDGNWYKEYPPRWDDDTPKREVMSNPFAQNDRHVAFLERFINELLGRGMADWVHVENIICIANDQVTLETDPSAKQTLTRVSNLYNQLTHDRTQKLTVEELEKIKAALKSKSLPGKKYPVPDYSKQMSWAAEWYRYLIETSDHIIDAARRCATDHPEFFTRIQ